MVKIRRYTYLILLAGVFILSACQKAQENPRKVEPFNKDWQFSLGDNPEAYRIDFDDATWRQLDLPHDWSIEGSFSSEHPSTSQGGALPTGIGWYRKSFTLDEGTEYDKYFIDFDGVYCNSEVWINGHYLGKRPFGYISFRYDLTPFLLKNGQTNMIAVKVDNSAQPSSRWYTGSGIYRNVWLVKTKNIYVGHWGSKVTSDQVSLTAASVQLDLKIENKQVGIRQIKVRTLFYDQESTLLGKAEKSVELVDSVSQITQIFTLENPKLWDVKSPTMYKAVTQIFNDEELLDVYETPFGIRTFEFQSDKGFFLNGKQLKLQGVNQHHDLGALGAAVNTRAMERQLEILKEMGCNAIRMAHNPPAPELLDLCDQMGFLVIDEAFDEWAKTKVKKGYHLYWDEWHVRDLQDMVLRDQNHPSIIAWSIGNEIREQFDSTGISITRELVNIVREIDTSRYITCALTEQDPQKNFIYQSGALDLISFNYKHTQYLDFPKNYPGENLLASENMSALATRGVYDMPSDSVRIWPSAHNAPLIGAHPDYTVSAYDHVYAYWGATHEETWDLVKKNDFVSGMFIWSGFDYLGEPIPYPYPARSSYLGIIDLAGFPKDAYYMYQSEWTNKNMLHVFPHWNWESGQTIDVWAYYNNADEVELFLNGESLGKRIKKENAYHVMWRVNYAPGTIKVVSRKDGQVVLQKEIHTAGPATGIELTADRTSIHADGEDLSFITVKIVDEDGNLVPDASNLVDFDVEGNGFIAGLDNGYQASLESFKGKDRKAFNGMCLLIVQSDGNVGEIRITANSDELKAVNITLQAK